MNHIRNKTEEEPYGIARFAWEQARDNVYPAFAPLGCGKGELDRNGLVHSGFLDLHVCYYLRMGGLGRRKAGAIWVSDTIREAWDVATDELESQAMENMGSDGYQFHSVAGILKALAGREYIPGPIRLYALTNRDGIYGASGILDHGLISGLAKEAGAGSLYILPSSRHEVLLIPDPEGTDAAGLSRIVTEINQTTVLPEDRLSNHVYYYNMEANTVQIA